MLKKAAKGAAIGVVAAAAYHFTNDSDWATKARTADPKALAPDAAAYGSAAVAGALLTVVLFFGG